YTRLGSQAFTPRTLRSPSKPDRVHICMISGAIPNRDPMISQTFVEVNYEVLESLLRERRRQKRNKDLRTKLEYFSEEYDEEREMEPRLVRNRETTPVLHMRSLRARRQREREALSLRLTQEETSLLTNGNPSFGGTSIQYFQRGYVPQALTSNNVPPYNGFMYHAVTPSNNYPFYTQPMYTPPNMSAYPNPGSVGIFTDPAGCVTPFVHWIEDCPLPDGLKMPFHVGSYDGKGDLDNYLHLFEGAIRMQK
ncbi:hypothetical protein Tco_1446486, partial [Tanacetum coccineum]